MNILNVLLQNFGKGSRTRQPDDTVPYPNGFRGQIDHDTSLCIACGACVYTCSPGAIQIHDNGFVQQWEYTEDRCTFCGRCVEYCPTQALQFKQVAPEPLTERKQHYLSHGVRLQICRDCGKPVRIIPESMLKELYGDPIPADILAARDLCEHCRQLAIGQRFMSTLMDKRGDYGN
jgi:formate hydrogenlyase subunit 6/NADH:ubiquinone oxidoreductase subunit I